MISEGALLALHTSGVRRVIAAAEPAALVEPPVDATARITRRDGCTRLERLEKTHGTHAQSATPGDSRVC